MWQIHSGYLFKQVNAEEAEGANALSVQDCLIPYIFIYPKL
jgi:hypothetical protein